MYIIINRDYFTNGIKFVLALNCVSVVMFRKW